MTPPATEQSTNEQLISLPAAAAKLDVSLRSFYRLIALGDLPPPVRVGRRASKMLKSDLDGYVQKLKAQRV
jgi:predicted DNA-binding transcriptional regulator AlpA